ncbi:MAG: hypothetical protein C7B44_01065 [Sulfobacillus thermosulfidooxidans]|nr:MAG: hypothetical protein C7B44_01065 [Sulfobacillus thermosulfidooxidans]
MPTILIIDDEAGIRYISRTVFAQHHFTVLEAESGHQGLTLLASHQPDVVLLDYRLPDMLGTEWISRAQAIAICPVVLMSASSELAALSRDPLVAATVAKPFRLEKLWQTVQRVLAEISNGNVTENTEPPPGLGT